MSYEDSLVGTVAITMALIAMAIAVGPWTMPYHLRSIVSIRERFGMGGARLAWVALSVACLIAGISILAGIRPSYATPSDEIHRSPAER